MPCSCTDYGRIYSTIVMKSLQFDVCNSLNLNSYKYRFVSCPSNKPSFLNE